MAWTGYIREHVAAQAARVKRGEVFLIRYSLAQIKGRKKERNIKTFLKFQNGQHGFRRIYALRHPSCQTGVLCFSIFWVLANLTGSDRIILQRTAGRAEEAEGRCRFCPESRTGCRKDPNFSGRTAVASKHRSPGNHAGRGRSQEPYRSA